MEKSKLCCEVCVCQHNVNGCECSRENLKITTGNESDSAHYCADYQEKI